MWDDDSLDDLRLDEEALGLSFLEVHVKRRLSRVFEPTEWTREDLISIGRTLLVAAVCAVLFSAVYTSIVGRGCADFCFPFAGRLSEELQCECADLDGSLHPVGW